jgi:glycosyltransferase involved in cell wall biosynthesis
MIKVSIITPLHNKEPYVAETIRSVLAQTMTDWEMIVVENGSTDKGVEVAKQFSDARIRLVSSLKQGPGVARNFGLGLATGEWILFLDADDLLEPHYLADQLKAAQRHPEAAVIAGCWQEFSHEAPAHRELKRPAAIGKSREQLLDSAIAFTCWAVHAALVRRNVFKPGLNWPEELDRFLGEDTTFWFRLVNSVPVAYSESSGALYRTQTADCRSQIGMLSRWFEGLHQAAQANVAHLEGLGQNLTAGQKENLFRLYFGLYSQALCAGDVRIADAAGKHAIKWLGERRHAASPMPFSLRLAHWIGLKMFVQLKQVTERLRVQSPASNGAN